LPGAPAWIRTRIYGRLGLPGQPLGRAFES
jgi:hypothetical protein